MLITDNHNARQGNCSTFSTHIYTNIDCRHRKASICRTSSYTINNQPTTTPNTESATGAIGIRSSASAPDLKAGPLLELADADELLVPPEVLDEVLDDEGVNVTLGTSDAGTAEMGAGAWPP